MAQFVITARHSCNIGGQHIEKGDSFNINIAMTGIVPTGLFGNSRCADTILKQLSAQGLELPKNSPILNLGYWDVKMK